MDKFELILFKSFFDEKDVVDFTSVRKDAKEKKIKINEDILRLADEYAKKKQKLLFKK